MGLGVGLVVYDFIGPLVILCIGMWGEINFVPLPSAWTDITV
jgi:hypothetical protein